MVADASVVGVFRTILILFGLFVVVRFFGQLARAKRNMDEERKINEEHRRFKEEKEKVTKNIGKTKIIKEQSSSNNVEDVDFEEV